MEKVPACVKLPGVTVKIAKSPGRGIRGAGYVSQPLMPPAHPVVLLAAGGNKGIVSPAVYHQHRDGLMPVRAKCITLDLKLANTKPDT